MGETGLNYSVRAVFFSFTDFLLYIRVFEI